MTTTHKPATPLPWECHIWRQWLPQIRSGDTDLFQASANGNCERNGKDDAAYIAHAANAYPKLVAALRRIDATISGSQAQAVQIDNAIALLRELGEGE